MLPPAEPGELFTALRRTKPHRHSVKKAYAQKERWTCPYAVNRSPRMLSRAFLQISGASSLTFRTRP
jgi:hypothetical protein